MKGQEQIGHRLAVIISNKDYGKLIKLALICSITNTDNHFPVHIVLDERTKISGCILCEHIRTVGLPRRNTKYVEKMLEDIFKEVKDIVMSFFA